jgi:serine/threonine protein kinase
VQTYEASNQGDAFFIATTYIEGRTLEQQAEQESLTFRQAAEMVMKLAGALDHAHRRGIWRRFV